MVDLVTYKTTHRGAPVLVPATKLDYDVLDKVRTRKPLRTEVVFSRSVEHMRWYRGLVAVVAEAIDMVPDGLHAELKFKAGLIERIILGSDGPFIELESCAFRRMDETRFSHFTNLAIEIIFRDYLPGVRRKDVFKRVEELVGPRPK